MTELDKLILSARILVDIIIGGIFALAAIGLVLILVFVIGRSHKGTQSEIRPSYEPDGINYVKPTPVGKEF